ncbi:MAG: hypothetical protein RMJ48_19515 [Roseiflexaceae bacterium]|nr:hypothetical protein [Roseiflexaceae bacterium]
MPQPESACQIEHTNRLPNFEYNRDAGVIYGQILITCHPSLVIDQRWHVGGMA